MPHTVLNHEDTGDSIHCSICSDGVMSATYQLTGEINAEEDSLFYFCDLQKLAGNPKTVRLDGIQFFIESGLKVIIKYRDQPHILPLEGRGKQQFEWIGGLLGHDIELVCKGTGSFFIIFDVSKIGV
mgnify:CR=1 FL=1